MRIIINGVEHEFADVRADETALELLRERCGLTGSKLVCGSGVCGACTVLVEGKPMVGCLLPAVRLADRAIQTIEYFDADNLHPVQRAFMAHDGLQCGYCTPGFIIEAIAFYKHWRRTQGTQLPSREQIAEALAGHLCRCGAYLGIYTAVQRACTGDFDEITALRMQRVDALAKVTGAARYTTDRHLEGQLVGMILRSPHAHARICRIDLEPARQMPGVRAVLPMAESGQVLRFVGQEIAAVAAVDAQAARPALDAIVVEYEVLPALITPEAAMAEGVPQIWAGQTGAAPNAGEGPIIPGTWYGNLRKSLLNTGGLNPARARQTFADNQANGGHTFAARFSNRPQIHTALEPHGALARWTGERQVEVYLSTQGVRAMAPEIAHHFDLDPADVTVIAEHVGGGFGAKNGLSKEAIAAVMLARASGAPVGVIYSRAEEMTVAGFRPGGRIDLQLAGDAEQRLAAMIAHSYGESGIAVSNIVTGLMAFGYSGGARDLLDYDVITNQPGGRPFRAPGGPMAFWALEQGIDQLAHDSGQDPLSLRRGWNENSLRSTLYDWVASLEVWRHRPSPGSQSGRFRRGVGLSCGNWFYFYDPETRVELEAAPDGFRIATATQEIGNGVRTVLSNTVAAVFGVAPDLVQVDIGNSQLPHGPIAGGSRVTASVFAPAREVAEAMRERLFGQAAEELDLAEARIADGGIAHRDGFLNWAEVLKQVPSQRAEARRGPDKQLIQQFTTFLLGQMGGDIMFGRGNGHAAIVVEVEVDTLLGKTRVLRVWQNLAVGKIHVPDLARSQVYGGVIQGIGYALYEEKISDPCTGVNLTSNLQDYKIPGIGDTPEIFVEFTPGGFEHARGEGIGMSELSTAPVAAAIGNAIFNATGWRPLETPVRPERLVEGVKP